MVVYFILAHSCSNRLLDLYRFLNNDDDMFIIHVDQKAPEDLKVKVGLLEREVRNVMVLRQEYCSWGGYSLTKAALRGVEKAIGIQRSWTHFILLSEHHLPLRSSAVLKSRLEEEKSYFVTYPMADFHGEGKRDLIQRFHRRYKELPGVGSFPVGARAWEELEQSKIFHAHQWTVLSRNACASIIKNTNLSDIDTFSSSILSDETAIPTVFMRDKGLELVRKQTTYIAYPHLTDNNDQIISDACFEDALASDMLFARKRPYVLTVQMDEYMEGLAAISKLQLDEKLQSRKNLEDNNVAKVDLSGRLLRNDVSIDVMSGNYVPKIYLRIRTNRYPASLNTYLLSEDGASFKVCSCYLNLDPAFRSVLDNDGIDSTMLRVRVNDLHSWHELHLNTNGEYDFFRCTSAAEFDLIAASVRKHIAYIEDIQNRCNISPGTECQPVIPSEQK